MPWIPNVTPNTVIASEWGNDIRDHVVTTLPTADFSQITAPHEGQYVHVENPGVLYLYTGSQFRPVARKDGNAWHWIDSAWGHLKSSTAVVGNPGVDPVWTFYDYTIVTIQAAGFGPFAITTPGNRYIQLNGVMRVDGGNLTSVTGNMEWYLRRSGAATDLAQGIASVSAQSGAGGYDTIAVVPLLAIDNPPAGTITYSLAAKWRGGTGSLRLMVPVALMASDMGPSTVTTQLGATQIQGFDNG